VVTAVVTVLVTALVAGCGSDGEEPQSSDAPPDATLLEGDAVEVKAIDNSWQPEEFRVAGGTEITFVNDGQNDHNLVPEDEGADWAIDGDDFHPGDEVSFTFDDPGVYRFYCSIHGTIDAGMPGVLVVE